MEIAGNTCPPVPPPLIITLLCFCRFIYFFSFISFFLFGQFFLFYPGLDNPAYAQHCSNRKTHNKHRGPSPAYHWQGLSGYRKESDSNKHIEHRLQCNHYDESNNQIGRKSCFALLDNSDPPEEQYHICKDQWKCSEQ